MKNIVIWLFGEVDRLLCALILFIVLEIITSLFVSIAEKKKWREKNFLCGWAILILVIFSNTVDTMIFENETEIRTAVIYFYLVNEGLTVMNNLQKIGLPLPDVLLKVIDILKKQI